jgi:phosphatidylinositol alpha 1,6-mannosyltransferase
MAHMKVAYFTESLPPSTDGVATSLARLAETLEGHAVDFRFFCPFLPGADYSWRGKVRRVWSVPFPLNRDYRLAIPFLQGIGHELDRFAPDLVHVASPTPLGVAGLRWARRHAVPVVSSHHTHFVSYLPHYRLRRLANLGWSYLRWFHDHCEVTYAPSASAAAELRRRSIDNVELWTRGVDLQRFAPSFRDDELRRSLSPDGAPILLYVGRLVAEKNLADLVRAAGILRAWQTPAVLVIVGDGPMRNALQQQLPHAHFPGFQYGDDLARWYASSDLLVFPSTTETFGNVVQEALASGLPVVGVQKGGVADLITPGRNGFLAEANAPLDLAQHIHALLVHDDVRGELARRARLSVAESSWESVNLKLLGSYERLLGRRAARQHTWVGRLAAGALPARR